MRLQTMGMRLPAYTFRPHLSLGYGNAPSRSLTVPPIGWQADELLLIKSIHGEGRHEPLAAFPLIARQGVLF